MNTTTSTSPATTQAGPALAERLLVLPDRLDVHRITELERQVLRAGLRSASRLCIDGSAVVHVDRAGLHFLEETRFHARQSGTDVCLGAVSLALRLAIEHTGLASQITHCDGAGRAFEQTTASAGRG